MQKNGALALKGLVQTSYGTCHKKWDKIID
jgi:hypothetical protein